MRTIPLLLALLQLDAVGPGNDADVNHVHEQAVVHNALESSDLRSGLLCVLQSHSART